MFEQLRTTDLRAAVIGYRLAAANAALCDRLEPGLGIALHTIDEYEPAIRPLVAAHFGFVGSVAIKGVIPESPAERAGLHADDSIVAIDRVPVAAARGGAASLAPLVALSNGIAALPLGVPIRIDVVRHGMPLSFTLRPPAICRSRFEVKISTGYPASSDGTMVQVGSRFIDELDDVRLAVVIAHEFAHNVLGHAARMQAQGITGGLVSGLGRNVAYFRQTETQADILSVTLLANAGYDPAEVGRFWRGYGRRHFASMFNDRSHPAWRDRAATAERAAGALAAHTERPIIPAILASRGRPLDGDWQAILVRD